MQQRTPNASERALTPSASTPHTLQLRQPQRTRSGSPEPGLAGEWQDARAGQGAQVGQGAQAGKVRRRGKVPNLVETFAHLDFGVFSAWEMGKVLKWLGMCVYPFAEFGGVIGLAGAGAGDGGAGEHVSRGGRCAT